ncbi:MAG TPA: DUF4974 domain-containing protein [Bacteroidetes bacterium]|nr:DUF4974 domain-containing protein [Bacteroidota bacterium]
MKEFDKYSVLIGKFFAGEASLAEKEDLFAWTKKDPANRAFFEETEQVWKMVDGAETTPFEADMDSAWAKIDAAVDTPEYGSQPTALQVENGTAGRSAKVVPLPKRMMRWSIAAAVLALLGLGLWWANRSAPQQPAFVEIQTLENEKKEITLPDSSHVWMNENSKIAYDQHFAKRKINLEGEAFFEVERMEESPFEIRSGEATTTVLGTSFNVRAYPKEEKIEVTVKTGKVALAVTKKEASAVILPAGTSGIVYKKEKKVEKVEAKSANADAWKTLRLDFDETPMKEVVLTLERYFGKEIKVANKAMLNCPYTSTFDQPDLDGILSVIGGSLGFEAVEKNGGYIIEGGSCE